MKNITLLTVLRKIQKEGCGNLTVEEMIHFIEKENSMNDFSIDFLKLVKADEPEDLTLEDYGEDCELWGYVKGPNYRS